MTDSDVPMPAMAMLRTIAFRMTTMLKMVTFPTTVSPIL